MSSLPPILALDAFERETLPLLRPQFSSRFGAVTWDQIMAPGPEHRWLVKGLLTAGELSMLAGASQSGKSFLTLDLAMSIALGRDWFGRKVERGGVIYEAGEGASGLRRRRIPAYMRENGLTAQDDVPFVLLPEKVNLWSDPAQTEAFIAEIKHWSMQMSEPLKLVIIDTLAKAMTGGDEISGKDMGVVIDRCDMIRRATGAAVLLVHHMNAGGEKVRGHTSIKANLDAVLLCRMAMTQGARGQDAAPIVDDDNRKVRELLIDKAKEGESDVKPFRFVLRAVEIGRDEENMPVTSCVVAAPAGEELSPRDGKAGPKPLNVKLSLALKALIGAIDAKGRLAPSHVPDAPAGLSCVTQAEWRDHLAALIAQEDEGPEQLKERAKKARDRAAEALIDRNYIRKHGDWVWRTARRVKGIDREDGSATAPASTHLSDQDQGAIADEFKW